MRCFCSLVDMLGEDSALPVECQGDAPQNLGASGLPRFAPSLRGNRAKIASAPASRAKRWHTYFSCGLYTYDRMGAEGVKL